jgi:hypothetical protein
LTHAKLLITIPVSIPLDAIAEIYEIHALIIKQLKPPVVFQATDHNRRTKQF